MATILVVDDDYGTMELLEVVLLEDGHQVLVATSGRKALDLLETEQPDLMFLDYRMPEIDGADVLDTLAANPLLQRIPVILMSAVPEATVGERCHGHVAFLRKPLQLEHVRAFAERVGAASM